MQGKQLCFPGCSVLKDCDRFPTGIHNCVMTKNAQAKTVQVCSGNVPSLSVPIVEQ